MKTNTVKKEPLRLKVVKGGISYINDDGSIRTSGHHGLGLSFTDKEKEAQRRKIFEESVNFKRCTLSASKRLSSFKDESPDLHSGLINLFRCLLLKRKIDRLDFKTAPAFRLRPLYQIESGWSDLKDKYNDTYFLTKEWISSHRFNSLTTQEKMNEVGVKRLELLVSSYDELLVKYEDLKLILADQEKLAKERETVGNLEKTLDKVDKKVDRLEALLTKLLKFFHIL